MKKSYRFIVLAFFVFSTSSIHAQFTTSGINTTTLDNVGIGTESPESLLHLRKNQSLASYPTQTSRGDSFQVFTNANNSLEFGLAGGSNTRRSWILSRHSDLSGAYGKYYNTLHLQPDTGDKSIYRGIAIGYNANEHISLGAHLAVNGSVGIGTTAPKYGKLQVYGNGSDQGINLWTDTGAMTSRIWIDNELGTFHLTKGGSPANGITITESGNIGIGTPNPQHGKLQIYGTGSDQGINLWTNSGILTSRIWIDNTLKTFHITKGSSPDKGITIAETGHVGIGTSTPKNKLSVNGTIWAKKVKIRLTDAADWVFEDNYKLRSLAEVQSFIDENKHLPEIPSASEFRANDMEVSEMTNKLLQKIEELTLYTIAQQEKLEQQNQVLASQEEVLIDQNMALIDQKNINIKLEKRLRRLEAILLNK
ncbi:hypothetical protein [Aquimarina pacifica]|uniref:hypothetical protein n=1 Tax=Aquimarina pacifica TaxID=1296415 RepID=UPI0004727BE7|nr:hypothetical protein [Aquimarina pacifica]